MSFNSRLGRVLAALAMIAAIASPALAVENSTPGVNGYDLVSCRTGEKPLQGNGNHVAVHDGVTYLFASDENRKAFDRNPDKFLPAYGGFCAFGVSVGKKFYGDPTVWEIVNGQLYLNLDNKIKGMWVEDIVGNVGKADASWLKIRKTPAERL